MSGANGKPRRRRVQRPYIKHGRNLVSEEEFRAGLEEIGITDRADQDRELRNARKRLEELTAARSQWGLELLRRVLLGMPPQPGPGGAAAAWAPDEHAGPTSLGVNLEFTDDSRIEFVIEQTGCEARLVVAGAEGEFGAPAVTTPDKPEELLRHSAARDLLDVDVDVHIRLPMRVRLPRERAEQLESPIADVVQMLEGIVRDQPMQLAQWILRHGQVGMTDETVGDHDELFAKNELALLLPTPEPS